MSQAAPSALDFAPDWIRRARERKIIVGILGLGYVGLPLAEAFVNSGLSVLGFDVDISKLENLNAGKSYIRHISDARIAKMAGSGRFETTNDVARLKEPDALLLCVPTPLNQYREPDLSYVERTCEMIANVLRRGQLVVLESTTWPGTSEEVMMPILESKTGLKAHEDFAIAYSPEREDPGNPNYSTTSIPKVVGANRDAERDMAVAMYDAVTTTVPVSDLRTAEAVKLTENIYRLVNIALVNELKGVFGEMGIDIWEVIDAAKTKPFGFHAFYPGPGLGGHCIPIDPFYLTWKAREFQAPTQFIELSGNITQRLPRLVVDAVAGALDRKLGKALSRSRILVIGLSYKENIDDLRESPSIHLIDLLRKRGAHVDYHDPYIPQTGDGNGHPEIANMVSVELTEDMLAGYDCALISTAHGKVPYEAVAKAVPLIVDTRNAMKSLLATYGDKIVKA